jgi:endonuclease YncB( thermonuclease family)
MHIKYQVLAILILGGLLTACGGGEEDKKDRDPQGPTAPPPQALSPAAARPPLPADLPMGRVTRVIDGQRLELSDGQQLRLIGISVPQAGQTLHSEATAFTRDLVEGQTVGLELSTSNPSLPDQTWAYVWVGDRLLNWEIVKAGYANRDARPPLVQYDAYLIQAEKSAIQASLGIWNLQSSGIEVTNLFADAPGEDGNNLAEEYVQLGNTSGGDLSLNGYTLYDASREHIYTFGDYVLPPGQRVKIRSGCGSAAWLEVYWCADGPVWDNQQETVFVADAEGKLAAYLVRGQ